MYSPCGTGVEVLLNIRFEGARFAGPRGGSHPGGGGRAPPPPPTPPPKTRRGGAFFFARSRGPPPIGVSVGGVQGRERFVGPNNQLPPATGGDGDGGTVGSVFIERFPNLFAGLFIQRQHSGPRPGSRGHNQQGTLD